MKVVITEDQFNRVILEGRPPINTDEFLLNKALEYEYPKQWENDGAEGKKTYKQAWNRGREFYDKATSHMEKADYSEKYIYVYEFYDGDTAVAAYVGAACSIDRRRKEHESGFCRYNNTERLTAVTKFKKENPELEVVFKELISEPLSDDEAREKEKEWESRYKTNGWEMLNIFPTGGLGKKFLNSNEKLRNIASKYKTKTEWREKDRHTYFQALPSRRGDKEFWDDITKDMLDGRIRDEISGRYKEMKVIKLINQQFRKVILKEDEEFKSFHAKAFEYMDRRYGGEKEDMGVEYAYYYPAKFKDEFHLSDDESKLLAYNYLKYNDGSGDYKKFIGKPFYTPDNLSLSMEDADLDLNAMRVRFTVNNKDLGSLIPPKSILPTTQIISFMNDNISHVDVTGYDKFSDLFIFNLLDNPVRTVNIPALIDLFNNHPTLAKFHMNYIPNKEFNEEHVQFIKDSLIEDRGIIINITPLTDD
jgi:hypothetical protein